MPRSGGYRRKTRSLLRVRSTKNRGLGSLLRQYNVSDKVVIDIDSVQVKGMPHRRFQGMVGTVEEVGRRAVTIKVPVGGKTKKVVARLEHVKPHKEG